MVRFSYLFSFFFFYLSPFFFLFFRLSTDYGSTLRRITMTGRMMARYETQGELGMQTTAWLWKHALRDNELSTDYGSTLRRTTARDETQGEFGMQNANAERRRVEDPPMVRFSYLFSFFFYYLSPFFFSFSGCQPTTEARSRDNNDWGRTTIGDESQGELGMQMRTLSRGRRG